LVKKYKYLSIKLNHLFFVDTFILNTHFTYFAILALSLAGPLLLSFDKKVAYYKQWKYLLPAITIAAIPYLVWDSYFTYLQVWQFNTTYIYGPSYFLLPIEEWLFFIIVPFCCMFIYECIRNYFTAIAKQQWGKYVLGAIGCILFIAGIIYHQKIYTAYTFIFCSAFIACLFIFKQFFKAFNASLFLVSYTVILIPFLIVNGFLTAMPILTYNNLQNLAIRLFTIPFEDVFYGMLLLLIITAFFEKFRASQQSN
jgi:lycopene cyclase domain-containing protein